MNFATQVAANHCYRFKDGDDFYITGVVAKKDGSGWLWIVGTWKDVPNWEEREPLKIHSQIKAGFNETTKVNYAWRLACLWVPREETLKALREKTQARLFQIGMRIKIRTLREQGFTVTDLGSELPDRYRWIVEGEFSLEGFSSKQLNPTIHLFWQKKGMDLNRPQATKKRQGSWDLTAIPGIA